MPQNLGDEEGLPVMINYVQALNLSVGAEVRFGDCDLSTSDCEEIAREVLKHERDVQFIKGE